MLDFIDLFIQPPGDFFYHTFVILAFSAGLALAYGQRTKHPQSRTASVYGAALAGALSALVILVGGALYILYTSQPADSILPPLERAINIALLLLITWAFLIADDEVWTGLPTQILLGAVTITTIAYIFTGVQWTQAAGTMDFNLTRYGLLWTFGSMIVALCGTVLMVVYFRRIIDAPLKFLFFVLILSGSAASLWRMANGNVIGDYSPFVRLSFFLASPIVPFVIYRKIIYGYELAFDAIDSAQPAAATPNRTVTAPAVTTQEQPGPLSQSKIQSTSS
ncbi:MAG: hypothetical protein AAF125_23010, partial [Chloroflexota bacterium]